MRECEKCGALNEDNASFCIACSHPLKADDTVGGVDTAPLPSPDPDATTKADLDPSIQLESGQTFANRYEIIEKIGQGGMGAVYHAKDTVGNNRDIALKLIKGSLLVDDKARERLINEGVLTQDIRHPNVVAVHNVGIHEAQPFIAMAYVEGVSMREWLIRNFNHRNEEGLRVDIPFLVVAQIIKAILDGLEAAHKLGIVHRDLKPENVILTAEPNEEGAALQILDFGIARAPGPALSTASGGMGTQGYMAPEQLTNPAGVDGSADLYSLSRMFYEMLMRAVPFGQMQDPSGGRTDVPKGIDDLIRKGLSDDAGRRPQSVAEYRAALNKAVAAGRPHKRKGTGSKDIERGKRIPPPPSPPEVPKGVLIGGGIGAAFLILIGIISAIPDDPGPSYGPGPEPDPTEAFIPDDPDPLFDPDPDPDPQPPPPPPPEEPDFSYLSGTWFGDSGSRSNVTVAPNGSFSGTVSNSADGLRYDFSGSLASGSLVSRSAMGEYRGGIVMINDSHLCYKVYDANGALFGFDRLHANHAASMDGGVCP